MINIFEYIKQNLPSTKDEILNLLNRVNYQITTEMREQPNHTLTYYNGLIKLLNKVILEITGRKIFDAPKDWFYEFSITNRKATLSLNHIAEINEDEEENNIVLNIDETFQIINYPVKQLSVEEYATVSKTEAVTVRQWIRRGKLRNAIKIGGEWRIPEITDTPVRGYTPVRYYNNGGYISFPKEFGNSLHFNPHIIDIIQSKEGKGYNVFFDACPAFIPERIITEAEREKLELILISNPNIANSSSVVGTWPNYKKEEKYKPNIRTGNMRLPKDWDIN